MKFTEDNIFIAPTPLKLAEEFANWFFAQAQENILAKGSFFVAVSGGNTPILFFNKLAEKYGTLIDWTKVHFFWADERCVKPTDHESNYKMAQTNFLGRISIPDNNVHRIHGEYEPSEETIRYAKRIESLVPSKNGLPTFDLILLGMGDDGHTASIFPGHIDVINSTNICESAIIISKNQTRITLTPMCINNAQKVAFQITGMSKSAIVQKILLKNGNCTDYPAAHIKPKTGQLYWFLDTGATKGLFS